VRDTHKKKVTGSQQGQGMEQPNTAYTQHRIPCPADPRPTSHLCQTDPHCHIHSPGTVTQHDIQPSHEPSRDICVVQTQPPPPLTTP
jgi:hypothetical protein